MFLSPESVAAWLKEHPDFFDQHSSLLANINIPHPHGTHAVSLSERQILALRDKTRALESRLNELIGYAENNDSISNKVHQLALKLSGVRSLEGVLHVAQHQLKDEFSVPHVALRLWNILDDRPHDAEGAEFHPVQSDLRNFVAHMEAPHCGNHAPYETSRWFDDEAPSLRSFALLPLRDKKTFGVMLLASPDEKRFYPDMGTLYLTRIAELIGAALRAHSHAQDLND